MQLQRDGAQAGREGGDAATSLGQDGAQAELGGLGGLGLSFGLGLSRDR